MAKELTLFEEVIATTKDASSVANVGRFITDTLLQPTALESFFRKDMPTRRDAMNAFSEALRLWRKVAYRVVGEESQAGPTRQNWLIPLLGILGYQLTQGMEIETEKGIQRTSHQFQPENYETPLALLDLIGWSDSLDERISSGGYRGLRSKRLEILLTEADVPWGILANGISLRLLRQDTTGERRYLELNLDSIFSEEDLEAFQLLYALCRSDAIIPSEDEDSFLARVIKESDAIGVNVSKALGESARVALEKLLQGLHEDEADGDFLPELLEDPENLERFYQEGLIFLYRLSVDRKVIG